jgi:uncharacterized membrane protein (UPF0127 family)
VTEANVRRAAWIVAALGVLALLLKGADAPANPSFETVPRQPLEGFTETGFVVETPDGDVLDWCALLAATAEARAQGLSGQQDLRGYEAMIFAFGEELSLDSFWMYRTVIPLSIAFFGGGGEWVSATDMEPCESTDASQCPVYPSAAPYRWAVEVAQGDLGRLGLEQGSKVRVGGPCKAPSPPT